MPSGGPDIGATAFDGASERVTRAFILHRLLKGDRIALWPPVGSGNT
jgi:hypothetical protein